MENVFVKKETGKHPVCYCEGCRKHERCLSWIAGQHVGENRELLTCVSPRYRYADTDQCRFFHDSTPVRMPCGMKHFYDDMPKAVAATVRRKLEEVCRHTRYYQYQNGTRPIYPDVLALITGICRECGWDKPLVFDCYVTDYLW